MMMEIIGSYSVPFVIAAAAFTILISDKGLFDEFLKGCKDGFSSTLRLLPTLIVLICAVSMFNSSGAMDVICSCVGEFSEKIGLPGELIPLVLTRPVSGSAATAVTNDIYATYGADSFIGRCASVIMGCSDTIIYTLAMYFGSAGVTKSRYAVPAAFFVFAFCVALSVVVTRFYFGF